MIEHLQIRTNLTIISNEVLFRDVTYFQPLNYNHYSATESAVSKIYFMSRVCRFHTSNLWMSMFSV